jgi:prohibitin 1
MKSKKSILTMLLIGVFIMLFQNCTIIQPAEVGVVIKFGKMKPELWESGMHAHGLFGIQVVRFSTRITNYSDQIHLPTMDGLEVKADVTLLYHLLKDSVQSVFLKFGTNYHDFVKSNFATSAREIFSTYYIKDIVIAKHEIEVAIFENVSAATSKYGIIVDQMLLKDFLLPVEYEQAIKNKVNSEQLAMQTKFDIDKERMELEYSIEKQRLQADWAIEQEKKEAERMQIEANALKKYQDTISLTMTEMYIRYKALEITEGLVTSPNTKVIITNGESPIILNDK